MLKYTKRKRNICNLIGQFFNIIFSISSDFEDAMILKKRKFLVTLKKKFRNNHNQNNKACTGYFYNQVQDKMMISTTEMAKPFNKKPADCLRLKSTKSLLFSLSEMKGIPVEKPCI